MPCLARLYYATILVQLLAVSSGLSIGSDLEPGSHAEQELQHAVFPGDLVPEFCVNIISPDMEYCWGASSERPIMAMMYHMEDPFQRVMWQGWSVQVCSHACHDMRHAALQGGLYAVRGSPPLIGSCIRCPTVPSITRCRPSCHAMVAMGSCRTTRRTAREAPLIGSQATHGWTACIPALLGPAAMCIPHAGSARTRLPPPPPFRCCPSPPSLALHACTCGAARCRCCWRTPRATLTASPTTSS